MVEVTKGAAQGPAYKERGCEYSACATAAVTEDGGHQLECTENQQRAKCQTSRESQRKSSIPSAGDSIRSKPVDRSHSECSSDQSSDSRPRPWRQKLQALKFLPQYEKRVGENQRDDCG